MRRTATLSAHAKVNLFLDVTEKRSDGYHNILTVFQEIALKDELKIDRRESPGVVVWSEPPIRDNIITKAGEILSEFCGLEAGFSVELTKQVPMGAGLGGGSSDAAAFLRFVRDEGYAKEPAEGWERLAGRIGSDVPFFLRGGCCVGRSKGEELETLEHGTGLHLVVVWPEFPMATSDRYSRLDPKEFGKGAGKFEALLAGLRSGDLDQISRNLYNAFEERALTDYPVLKKLKIDLREAGATAALLSGSGSSVFGIFPSRASANAARDRLASAYMDVFVTKAI